jgi:putative holin Dp-1
LYPSLPESENSKMTITGKTYDTLKWIAQVALPALGTLYFALAGIWGLPAAEQVVGTIVAVDTFLGVVLHISSNNFTANTAKGVLNMETTPEGKLVYNLELNGDPQEELEGKDRVIFDVKQK